MDIKETIAIGITIVGITIAVIGTLITISKITPPSIQPGVTIIKTDYKSKTIYIKLHPLLTTGSDEACYAAALIINAICEQGWKVYVTNNWVPSAKNPINLEQSRKLIKNEGKP